MNPGARPAHALDTGRSALGFTPNAVARRTAPDDTVSGSHDTPTFGSPASLHTYSLF